MRNKNNNVARAVRLTQSVALFSNCMKRHVGCVIFRPDLCEIRAIGYNHAPWPHACQGGKPCGCVHAEAEAMSNLHTHAPHGLVMFCSLSPCVECAELIIRDPRIAQVWWIDQWKDNPSKPVFFRAGIESDHYSHISGAYP
jgi:deoxycytidylate deaminase